MNSLIAEGSVRLHRSAHARERGRPTGPATFVRSYFRSILIYLVVLKLFIEYSKNVPLIRLARRCWPRCCCKSTKLALSAKDPQELVAIQTALLQPAAQKAAACGRYVYEIAASTSAEVSGLRRRPS